MTQKLFSFLISIGKKVIPRLLNTKHNFTSFSVQLLIAQLSQFLIKVNQSKFVQYVQSYHSNCTNRNFFYYHTNISIIKCINDLILLSDSSQLLVACKNRTKLATNQYQLGHCLLLQIIDQLIRSHSSPLHRLVITYQYQSFHWYQLSLTIYWLSNFIDMTSWDQWFQRHSKCNGRQSCVSNVGWR